MPQMLKDMETELTRSYLGGHSVVGYRCKSTTMPVGLKAGQTDRQTPVSSTYDSREHRTWEGGGGNSPIKDIRNAPKSNIFI